MEKNRISNISTVSVRLCGVGSYSLGYTDAQQHRLHLHTGPQPVIALASYEQSEGQQLRHRLYEWLLGPHGCLVVCVFLRRRWEERRLNYTASHFPRAPSWPCSAQGRVLLDHRLEADLGSAQAVQETPVHLHLPFRILPSRRCEYLRRLRSDLSAKLLFTGIEHYRNLDRYLSERSVPVFILEKHVLGSGASCYIHG